MRDAGWAFMGHGVIQRSLEHEDDEVPVIAKALETVSGFTSRPVRSWLGPGFGETEETPEHLTAAGIEFLYDWCLDDLPCWLKTAHGPRRLRQGNRRPRCIAFSVPPLPGAV